MDLTGSRNFLPLQAQVAVADTRAVSGMIGLKKFIKYCESVVFQRLLGYQAGQQKYACSGIGGAVRTLFSTAIPLGMGSIAGLPHVAFVDPEAPLLLLIGLLRGLKSHICCDSLMIHYGVNSKAYSELRYLPSGHCVTDVTEGLENFSTCYEAADLQKEEWHDGHLRQQLAIGRQQACADRATLHREGRRRFATRWLERPGNGSLMRWYDERSADISSNPSVCSPRAIRSLVRSSAGLGSEGSDVTFASSSTNPRERNRRTSARTWTSRPSRGGRQICLGESCP